MTSRERILSSIDMIGFPLWDFRVSERQLRNCLLACSPVEQSDSDSVLTMTPNHAGPNGLRSPGLKRMQREMRWEGAELDEENIDKAKTQES